MKNKELIKLRDYLEEWVSKNKDKKLHLIDVSQLLNEVRKYEK